MVTQNKWRMHEVKYRFFRRNKRNRFVTALDLKSKAAYQIKEIAPYLRAPISELPSNIRTMILLTIIHGIPSQKLAFSWAVRRGYAYIR